MLDEPVSSLDLSTQAQVLNLLADLRDYRKLALLFIAHDLGVVRFLAQRVVVLYRGQVMEAGGVEEVTQRPRHPVQHRADGGGPGAAARRAGPPPRRARGAWHRDGRRDPALGDRLPVRLPLPAGHRRLPHASGRRSPPTAVHRKHRNCRHAGRRSARLPSVSQAARLVADHAA